MRRTLLALATTAGVAIAFNVAPRPHRRRTFRFASAAGMEVIIGAAMPMAIEVLIGARDAILHRAAR